MPSDGNGGSWYLAQDGNSGAAVAADGGGAATYGLKRVSSNTGADFVISGMSAAHIHKQPPVTKPTKVSLMEDDTAHPQPGSLAAAPAGSGNPAASALAPGVSSDLNRKSLDRRKSADKQRGAPLDRQHDPYSAFNKEWEMDPRDVTVVNEAVASGAFGDVYRASWRGITVCVKRLKPAFSNDAQALAELRAELSIWCRLHHVRSAPSRRPPHAAETPAHRSEHKP